MTRASSYDSVYSWLESTKVRKPRDHISCSRMSCMSLILMKASLLRSFHFAWRCFNGILVNGVMSPRCKINQKRWRFCPWSRLTRKLIFVMKFSYNWVVRTYTDGCRLFSQSRAVVLYALTSDAPLKNIVRPSDSSNLYQFVSLVTCNAN